MQIDAAIFGQAAAELMRAQLLDVKKTHHDFTSRLAALEKIMRGMEKEIAIMRDKMQAQDVERALAKSAPAAPPERGEKGEAGAQGEKGEKGEDGRGIARAEIIAGDLWLHFTDGAAQNLGRVEGEAGAPGARGEKGEAGARGERGEAGARGEKGEKGEKGESVRSAIIDNAGALILTFSDGSTQNLGRVVGESLHDFTVDYLPETHEIAMRATCAGVTKTLKYPAGGIRALGYWREGKSAKAGEAVSLGGCLYIARKDTTAKPSYDNPDWFLAVQKGRDMTHESKGISRNAEKPVPLISANEGKENANA